MGSNVFFGTGWLVLSRSLFLDDSFFFHRLVPFSQCFCRCDGKRQTMFLVPMRLCCIRSSVTVPSWRRNMITKSSSKTEKGRTFENALNQNRVAHAYMGSRCWHIKTQSCNAPVLICSFCLCIVHSFGSW